MQEELVEKLAKIIEGLQIHLSFAHACIEGGWNANDERLRALHLQAAMRTIEEVKRENEAITEKLYQRLIEQRKTARAKEK